MSAAPASFVWYELMTTDAKAATAFYRNVVGWVVEDASRHGMTYGALLAGEVPGAGLTALPGDACDEGAKPAWIGYLGVDDVDAHAGKVTKAGGKVHVPPTDIPNIGRFAMLADPQGVAFNLFTPSQAMSRQEADPARPGTVGWHELVAIDGEKAFAFYADLFGWTKAEAVDMGAMGRYQLFAAGGAPLGGIMTKPPGVPMPFWTYYFRVAGIGAALQRLEAGGGTVINGPMQVPGGSWIVQAFDPQGALFSLVSLQA